MRDYRWIERCPDLLAGIARDDLLEIRATELLLEGDLLGFDAVGDGDRDLLEELLQHAILIVSH